jgi:hypothetical protein
LDGVAMLALVSHAKMLLVSRGNRVDAFDSFEDGVQGVEGGTA